MKFTNFLSSITQDLQVSYALLFKNTGQQFEVLSNKIKSNDEKEVKNYLQNLSPVDKKLLWARSYRSYAEFLGQIKSKKILEILISNGLDIDKAVPSTGAQRIYYDLLPRSGSAMYHVLANQKNAHRLDLFDWLVECGAQLDKKTSAEQNNNIVSFLLGDYVKYARDKELFISFEEKANRYLNSLELLKKNSPNWETDIFNIAPVLMELIETNKLDINSIGLEMVFKFFIEEKININFKEIMSIQVIETQEADLPSTIFTYACETYNNNPAYINLLLEKYKNNLPQLKEFENQKEKQIFLKPSKELLEKIQIYIEAAEFKRKINTIIEPPSNTNGIELPEIIPAQKKKVFKM